MTEAYHKGELQIQEKFGELKAANRASRMITNSIIPGAVVFIENQTSVIVSSTDNYDDIWISVLIGEAGFTKVSELTQISFNTDMINNSKTDIFFTNIKENLNIGSLFIEFGSRRRYRINGSVQLDDSRIDIVINEAYPNCPKYIQRRLMSAPKEKTQLESKISFGKQLSEDQKQWILTSDTLFVGTQSASEKLDASHRGGNPGFIELLSDNSLKIPDYVGNKMYNTLGNISQNKKAGLLFIDFKNKRILQITGKAALLFDQHSEEDELKTTGTGRYWLFKPTKWIQTDNHHDVDWEFLDASPLNP